MKSIYLLISALIFGAICFGCKTNKIIVIDGGNAEPTTMKAFNDERYIWENWNFSTNRVENVH